MSKIWNEHYHRLKSEIHFLIFKLIKHSVKTAVDVLHTEGFIMLIRKFFRYYFWSIFFTPLIMWKSKKITGDTPIDTLVDFVLSDNYGVLRSGQVRSEITKFLSIVQKMKPQVIVEIGTATGGTLFTFSRILNPTGTLISIDLPYGRFGGGYHVWRIPFYKSFVSKHQKIFLLRSDSHTKSTFNTFKQIVNKLPIDMLFIDGDHSYEGVKKDFEMYSLFVRKGGIIAFHDIADHNRLDGCDVDLYWEETKRKYKFQEIIGKDNIGWGGIGVIFKQTSHYLQIGDRDDKLPTLFAEFLVFFDDFFCKIPRQKQCIVGSIGDQVCF